jgi:hypothetical protein
VKEKKMRRSEIKTKKIIILVILSGFFNLLSYSFDQMVIQSELKNRDLERRIISNRIKLESLSYEIVTLTDLSFDIFKSSDYFFNHLPINMFGSSNFRSNKKIREFLGKEKSDKIGINFLVKLDEMILDFNKKIDEIDKIFVSMFPSSKTVFPILELKINKNILNTMKPNPLNSDLNENELLNWGKEGYKIYSLIYEKLETFESYEFHFDYYLDIAQDKYVKNFSNFYNLIDDYAEQQNKINYYILLSIMSQILGILFILLLFKSIIIKLN